jgi:type IV pilus assembly protein PilA
MAQGGKTQALASLFSHFASKRRARYRVCLYMQLPSAPSHRLSPAQAGAQFGCGCGMQIGPPPARGKGEFVARSPRGFTLIEMVIVIAIIAILALMALPSLMGQTARNQIKESVPLMDLAKSAVQTFYRDNRELPSDNLAAKLPPPERISGNYVASVTVKDGAITMTFGNKVSPKLTGKKLSIRPAIDKEYPSVPIAWLCNVRPAPGGKTVVGANETNIDGDALPVDCR